MLKTPKNYIVVSGDQSVFTSRISEPLTLDRGQIHAAKCPSRPTMYAAFLLHPVCTVEQHGQQSALTIKKIGRP